MDLKSMADLLNFSKFLIQDGELTYLYYYHFPRSSKETERRLRDMITFREKELRDADKNEDPEALRQVILENLENEKEYEPFRDSDDHFKFAEISLVFQMQDDYVKIGEGIDYRMVATDRFENHPSLGSNRYFNGGYEYYFLGRGDDALTLLRASQFTTTRHVCGIETQHRTSIPMDVIDTANVPPSNRIDETRADMQFTEFADEKCYVITHFPFDHNDTKVKIYVRLSPLPEIFREEYLYKSESPNVDTDGYWLRLSKDYSDFQTIDSLSLVVPKVRDHKEFRSNGRLRRQTVYTIKDMDFNLGLPEDYFDWKEIDLDDDNGNRKEVARRRNEVE